jgi:hypothetical protein
MAAVGSVKQVEQVKHKTLENILLAEKKVFWL